MKKPYTFLVMVMMFALQPVFAQTDNSATVKEQLENLNKYWKDKNFDYPILKERIPLTSDVPLIKMHLSLVEKTLRNKNTSNLSTEQKENRNKCLDILHSYWTKGVFPKNLYHKKRTPYFIDNFGTACAVGQLVISTGHADFAKKISKENNYAYIEDMNYPELFFWTDNYGLTIDELEWIQPEYDCTNLPCTPGISRNVSCFGGNDGCGHPNPAGDGWPSPYTYNWYYWNGTTWVLDIVGGWCNLYAGTYKAVVIDGLGNPHDYFYTITQPPKLQANLSITNASCQTCCDGIATANTTGGTLPFTYMWCNGATTQTISGLCVGCCYFSVTDGNNCKKIGSACVGFTVGLTELNSSTGFSVYPNPFSFTTTLQTNIFLINASLTIYNSVGQAVKQIDNMFGQTIIFQRDGLPSGLYFIRITQDNKTFSINKLLITDN